MTNKPSISLNMLKHLEALLDEAEKPSAITRMMASDKPALGNSMIRLQASIDRLTAALDRLTEQVDKKAMQMPVEPPCSLREPWSISCAPVMDGPEVKQYKPDVPEAYVTL